MGVWVLISILWCVCLFRSLFISSGLLVRCLMLYPSTLTPPSLKGWSLPKRGKRLVGFVCLFFTCLKSTWGQGLSNSESHWLGNWGDSEQNPLKKARETVPQIQWLLTKYVRITQKGSKHLPKVSKTGSYLGFILVRSIKGAGGPGRTTVSEVIKPRICGEAYLPQSPAGEGQTHSLSPRLASWTRTQAKALGFYLLLFPMQV